jgi:tRNA (guanine-N1)-methyltransferase
MVLMAEPLLRAVSALKSKSKKSKCKIVVFSAKGKQFNQKMAYNWSKKYNNFIFITGRYEGIDERVTKILKAEEISIGPYVLTDGDVAAMTVVSALVRLVPNVINFSSLEDESFIRKEIAKGDLEYPHYTRPEVLTWRGRKYKVPRVLLSGDHAKISAWRDEHRN